MAPATVYPDNDGAQLPNLPRRDTDPVPVAIAELECDVIPPEARVMSVAAF